MKNGTQIIYFPPHVEFGDETHPATEFGFVYGQKQNDAIFCRYWSNLFPQELRTKANGELTPLHRIMVKDTRNQQLIWKEIRKIERV